jgi:hypothetical protein
VRVPSALAHAPLPTLAAVLPRLKDFKARANARLAAQAAKVAPIMEDAEDVASGEGHGFGRSQGSMLMAAAGLE